MAKKSLSERIAERITGQNASGRKQRFQAMFLANREEIQHAANNGWKVKTIWETLHSEGVFEGTYECFLVYFNKLIKKDIGSENAAQGITEEKQIPAPEILISHTKNQKDIPTFRHPREFNTKALLGD